MTQVKYAISKIRTATSFFGKKNYYAARTDITMAKLTLREIERDLTRIIRKKEKCQL